MDTLWQFAVLLEPTDAEKDGGKRSVIVVQPSEYFVAKSEEEARMFAARKIPQEHLNVSDRLVVAVRPF